MAKKAKDYIAELGTEKCRELGSVDNVLSSMQALGYEGKTAGQIPAILSALGVTFGRKTKSEKDNKDNTDKPKFNGFSANLRNVLTDLQIAFPDKVPSGNQFINVGTNEAPKLKIAAGIVESIRNLYEAKYPPFLVIARRLLEQDWAELGIETVEMRERRIQAEKQLADKIQSAKDLLLANGFSVITRSNCLNWIYRTEEQAQPENLHDEVSLLLYPFHYVAERKRARREAGMRRAILRQERLAAERERQNMMAAALPDLVAFTEEQEELIRSAMELTGMERDETIATLKRRGKLPN